MINIKLPIILLLLSNAIFSQTKNVNLILEIKDTTETAYNYYYTGKWVQKGFAINKEEKKDSIGINKVRIKRLFYNTFESNGTIKKVYLKYEEKEYLEKKSNDYPNSSN